jgi:hypothetical protein
MEYSAELAWFSLWPIVLFIAYKATHYSVSLFEKE